jgi:hypothetical protein
MAVPWNTAELELYMSLQSKSLIPRLYQYMGLNLVLSHRLGVPLVNLISIDRI